MFPAALLCKEQAAVLPGIFIIIDLLWRRFSPSPCTQGEGGGEGSWSALNWKTWLWRWLPTWAMLAGYFLWRRHIFGGRTIHIAVQHHPLQFIYSMLYGLQTTIAPYVPFSYEPPFAGWFYWPLMLIAAAVLMGLIVGVMRSASSIGNRQSAIGNQSP